MLPRDEFQEVNFMTKQINKQRLIEDLAAMVRIPSVNGFGAHDPDKPDEEAMAVHLERELQNLGLEVESQMVSHGRRNVWGTLKGSGDGPTVMLAGHLDTVGVEGYDAPFDPKVEDGLIYGRGACDMKASFATYFEVVRHLRESGETLSGDLIVAGVVDEEYAMTGSRHFGENGPKVDYAIVGEPSNLALCPVHKGQLCFGLRTHGVSVHSSVPEKGVNAIFHMTAVLNALQDYAEDLKMRPAHPLCGTPTLCVGVINGGEMVSSVPNWCEIEIDRRTIPGESHEEVMREIETLVEGVAKTIPDFKYEFLSPSLDVEPLGTELSSAVMVAAKEAYEAVLEKPAEIRSFSGSTDAPNFKCPSVICGAGSLAQCHSLNEYVSIEEMKDAVAIYLHMVRSLISG